MIRIFMTGDNHIGLKYASHENAGILAESRINAFAGMVEEANSEKCDLFVITGDLFENTYSIPKKTVAAVVELLAGFHGTVAILPGNHDYYDKDAKLWQDFRSLISARDNIMLLTEYRPYDLTIGSEEVTLYPALCTSLHSAPGQNNLGWIKEENIVSDSRFRIGIAHGAVEGETIDSEGQYFMMKRAELESIPVDAWLIGHTHVPFPRELTDEYAPCDRILNAGTHVQTDVSCNTEGLCFIVEISDDKKIRARKFNSGSLRFYRREVVLSAGKMEEILDRELSGIGDTSVVDLVLSGAVSFEEYRDRHDIIEKRLSRFVEGTYSDSALSELISPELISTEFPETSFSAGLLTALLDDPKEAQLTYEMLKSLREGK